jgi:hypothetical protein
MKHTDILYGLEIVIFQHPRKQWHHDLLDQLQDKGYIDFFTWYDYKIERHRYQLNATHKGLMYYATKRSKRKSKMWFVLATAILLIPYLVILLGL